MPAACCLSRQNRENRKMQLSFGTNRFHFLDPHRLIQSCKETEAAGFDHLWFPDSQLHAGDVFVNLLTAAQNTERAHVGTLIVNPVTRHPSVLAASIAAVDRYAPGRVMLGVGAGDTAVLQVGLRPARLAGMERAVPVIVAGGGPKMLRMAGRRADGVVMRVGTDPELIEWAHAEFCAGAREAGHDPASLFVALHFHTVRTDDTALA